MKRAAALALAIGLALAQRAVASTGLEAVLLGANEVPGPGLEQGSFVAVVVVDGTKVSLTLTPKGAVGTMSAHIHRGEPGAVGRVVVEFPWASSDGKPRTWNGSVTEKVAADLVAHPEQFYVDVHTPAFPAGAARGPLAARANAEVPPETPAPAPPEPAAEGAGNVAADAPPPLPAGGRARPTKAAQRIVGRAPETKTYLDRDFNLDVRATSGLEVVYFASGECTVDGPYVHITGAGRCLLEAHQPGDDNTLAASIVDLQFPIARARQAIDFPDVPGPHYGRRSLSLVARASSGLPVSFRASGPCQIVGSRLRPMESGECTVFAEQKGDGNFNAAPIVSRTFVIVFEKPTPD